MFEITTGPGLVTMQTQTLFICERMPVRQKQNAKIINRYRQRVGGSKMRKVVIKGGRENRGTVSASMADKFPSFPQFRLSHEPLGLATCFNVEGAYLSVPSTPTIPLVAITLPTYTRYNSSNPSTLQSGSAIYTRHPLFTIYDNLS